MNKLNLLSVLLCLVFNIFSCNEYFDCGDLPPENVPLVIKGKIALSTLKSSSNEADYQLVVIYNEPVDRTAPKNTAVHSIVEVEADGSFEFNPDEGKPFVMFLVDNNATPKTVGVIGIGTGNNEYWENLSSEHLSGEIALGDITTSTQNALLETENDIDEIGTITEKELIISKISRVDNCVRYYKNLINSGFTFFAAPQFSFHSNKEWDSEISPSDYSYNGYQMLCWGDYIGDNAYLTPPANVATGDGTTYSPSAPIEGENFVTIGDVSVYGFITGESSDRLLQGEIPTGDWILSGDGTTTDAILQYSAVVPMQNDKVTFPIPVVTFTTENNKIIQAVISWQMLSETGNYEPIDASLLSDRITEISIEFCDFRQGNKFRHDYIVPIELEATTAIAEQNWFTNQDTEQNWADIIVVSYNIDGVFYNFKIRDL